MCDMATLVSGPYGAWHCKNTRRCRVRGRRCCKYSTNAWPICSQAAESAPDEICLRGSAAALQPSEYLPNIATQLRQPGARATPLHYYAVRSAWYFDTQPALD